MAYPGGRSMEGTCNPSIAPPGGSNLSRSFHLGLMGANFSGLSESEICHLKCFFMRLPAAK